jgi:hypothetical protein
VGVSPNRQGVSPKKREFSQKNGSFLKKTEVASDFYDKLSILWGFCSTFYSRLKRAFDCE